MDRKAMYKEPKSYFNSAMKKAARDWEKGQAKKDKENKAKKK